ncbi:hypothetical protein N7G274_010391 [Stereocaulon virgatum]|uniref:Uncharacterized protein n=1 Tax=Stereocaulon virgatum TaxID=373712 RepID=A0ABR4A0J5_9LECA
MQCRAGFSFDQGKNVEAKGLVAQDRRMNLLWMLEGVCWFRWESPATTNAKYHTIQHANRHSHHRRALKPTSPNYSIPIPTPAKPPSPPQQFPITTSPQHNDDLSPASPYTPPQPH